MRRRESPTKRVNPSGKVVWIARYTGRDGKRRIAKPDWNGGKGTFVLKRDAQRAIDEAYDMPDEADTVGEFFDVWPEKFPRSERTDATNTGRVRAVLDVSIEGRAFRDWPMRVVKRKQVNALVDHMLRNQGRAASGARNILRSLSAMWEDAIGEEVADTNPIKGVKVKANDRRVQKPRRKTRVWTFDQMREFAAAGRAEVRANTERPKEKGRRTSPFYSEHNYEPMLLTFPLLGLRLGEVLALREFNLDPENQIVHPTGNAHRGKITDGDTEEKRHDRPVPAPALWWAKLKERTTVPGAAVLFPTPSGTVWLESNFYRDVWRAAQIASGMSIRPHECRHSYISQLRAEGVDAADLAAVAAHTVETMTSTYTHPLGRSFDQIREVIDQVMEVSR